MERQAQVRPLTSALVAIGCVAVVALACALLVRSSCLDPGPPVSRPEPGTPLAGYCGRLEPGGYLLLPIVVPVLIAAVGQSLALARRRPAIGGVAVVVACLLAIAGVLVARSLTYSRTI